MLQDIKNTLKQSAIYGLSRISLKFISLIITPVISIYFTVSEYGVLDRFERFWQILYAISLFGLETAILRWYTLTDDPEKKKSIIFTATSFLILLNVGLLIIGSAFAKFFSTIIFNTEVYSNILIYTFLISGFEALLVVPLSLLRAENKAGKYLTITITATIISLILQLYFLIYTNIKLEGIFISKFIAPFIAFIILLPFLLNHVRISFDKENLLDIIRFSFPLMLTGIASNLLNSANRFILGFVGTSDEVGLFSLASNISGLITFLFISPFQLAFNVIFWQKLKDENAGRFYTKSVTYSFLVYVWAAIDISLLIPYAIKVYIPKTPAYWKCVNLVPILSMSLVFYGMLTIIYMSFHHAKRNDLIFYFLTGSLILNITLNYLLIPVFGMYGASISTFISFFVLIISMYNFTRKLYFIKYESGKLFLIFLIAIVIISVFYNFQIHVKWMDIIIRILICILFPLFLLPFKIYEPVEISTVSLIAKKYLRRNAR